MRDKTTERESKVPLLGDIPVLGWLFKNRAKNTEKVNLLFFLTPRILANYQRDSAETVKDLLNRRSAHLKDVIGEDDPFGNTAKGLYEKAKDQGKGPLYQQDDTRIYKQNNDGPGISTPEELEAEDDDDDFLQANVKNTFVPNYKEIYQRVRQQQAAIKK